MLHHVSIGVAGVERAAEFYDPVLGALGYKRTAQYLPYAIAYGQGVSEFWIQLPHNNNAASPGNGAHFGFTARTKEAVHRFHETALANGGTDDGPPGPRPQYGPDYYGAFVVDPFGNKVEATFIANEARKRDRRARGAKRTRKTAAKRRPARAAKAKRANRAQKRKARRR